MQAIMHEWDSLPTIDAGRVSLREMIEADIDALYTIFSNEEVMRYWSSPAILDRDAAAGILREVHDAFKTRAMLKWGVARRTDDAIIGTVTLYNISMDHRRAEMGYALGRANWGQGYMHEALQALLDFSFGALDLHRIEADVDPRNAASIRTLERLGFQREGYLRERWQVNGEIQDALFYALLRPDWQTLLSGRDRAV
jgi:ribosomal-protein-alanine N-acetyltransferase